MCVCVCVFNVYVFAVECVMLCDYKCMSVQKRSKKKKRKRREAGAGECAHPKYFHFT